jgi:L-alanine-DL-glutamate epimerase-like enolase superfamily enzyme
VRAKVIIEQCEAHHHRERFAPPRGGSGLTGFDLIIVHVGTSDGVEGWGFSYVLRGSPEASVAAARSLVAQLRGAPLQHPEAMWRNHVQTFNRSGGGPNLIALAAVDVALWDVWAKKARLPLAAALGGQPRDCSVYASDGFRPGQDPEEAAALARDAIAAGYCGVKPRVEGSARDRQLLMRVRETIGDEPLLMADANEKLGLLRAAQCVAAGREVGLAFLEEPLPSADVDGLRQLARLAGIPLATGEHFQSLNEAKTVIAEHLVGLIQPDLAMLGGLTPCLNVLRLAEAFGVEVAPHFLPGLFVHLAAVSPNVILLEDFPLLEPLFDGWPRFAAGKMQPRSVPGHGLTPINGLIR